MNCTMYHLNVSLLFQIKEIDTDNTDFLVSFLKKVKPKHYIWPDPEDLSWVASHQIIKCLDSPELDRNMRMTFNYSDE